MTRKLVTVLFPDHQRRSYTPEMFSALCAKFNIPSELRDELLRRLEDSAAVWRRYRRSEEIRVPSHEVRQELRKFAKEAAKLRAAYDALSDNARKALTVMQQQRVTEGVRAALEAEVPPYPYLRAPSVNRAPEALILELSDIAQLVEGLGFVAEDAAEWVPPQKAGTRRSEALRMWMENAHLIWTELLGREFTRYALADGEPISEASQFCVAAFHPVDPDTPQTRIDNAMRQLIAKLNSTT